MLDSVFEAIEEWIRTLLTNMVDSNLTTMFADVNEKTGQIASQVGQTPQGWNSGIYSMIQNLSNSVIMPIAGIIITFVLCYELISMLTEKNNMHDIDTWMFFKYFFKMMIAVYLVSNTFTITMAVFDLGQSVVNAAAGVISGETAIDVSTLIAQMDTVMESMEIGELVVLALETLLVSFCMKVMSIVITIICYGRMIEIYLYTSVAPIPFATMTNREWGQIGNNYFRGLFALAFQAFLMMVCVGIYSVLIATIHLSDNMHVALFSVSAYTVLLCYTLMKTFSLTEVQAQAILDLRLQKLTNLELLAIEKEYKEVKKLIAELEAILASDTKLVHLIKKELLEVRKLFDGKRKTQIISADAEIEAPNAEPETVEEMIVAVCADLKIRKCLKRQFNLSQIRADKPERILEVNSNAGIRLFTNHGAMLNLKVSDIPETKPSARAANLVALVELEKGETVVGAFPDSDEGSYLFCTAGGMVKRSKAADYRVRGKRTAAINLKDKDQLLGVYPMPTMNILLVTERGMCIRFASDSVPETGRTAAGVIGIKLEPKDRVMACMPVGDEGELIVLTDRGFGKRSFLFDYELQGRNGKGVKTFDFRKNGSNGTRIAYAGTVQQPFTLVIEQRHGTKTPLNTEQIHIEPKASKGEMLLAVVLDDDVVSAYRSDD